MIKAEYIEVISGELIAGYQAEKILNSRSFYSVFKTEDSYKVIYRDKVIGELTTSIHFQIDQNIFLAAKMWKIIAIDGRKLEIYVKEAADGKRPVFSGSGGNIHKKVREKMLEILMDDSPLPDCDKKGQAVIAGLREQFLAPGRRRQEKSNFSSVRPVFASGIYCEFFTFTGTKINKTLELLFKRLFGNDFFYDEIKSSFRLPLEAADSGNLIKDLRELLVGFGTILGKALSKRESSFEISKWGEFLTKEFKKKMLMLDYFDIPGTREYLDKIEIKIMNDE